MRMEELLVTLDYMVIQSLGNEVMLVKPLKNVGLEGHQMS